MEAPKQAPKRQVMKNYKEATKKIEEPPQNTKKE